FFPLLFRFRAARRLMYRTVSQTSIDYRDSTLSEGRAGSVHGGDRLPWARADDNFAPLRSLDWQVHVYGTASPGLAALCRERQLPLHTFPWSPAFRQTGLRRDAAYLVRPDSYVALADPAASPRNLAAYLDARRVRTRDE
ncbi:MAG TPA: FAD-dependent oxidoreductase, partial [Thermoanaerobaculia bacterium]|nr:FAD-dependent oxidoreductase [Thermoanaerobaculia bacterium]